MGVDQLWRQQALGWGSESAREKEMKSLAGARLMAPLFPGLRGISGYGTDETYDSTARERETDPIFSGCSGFAGAALGLTTAIIALSTRGWEDAWAGGLDSTGEPGSSTHCKVLEGFAHVLCAIRRA